LLNKKYNRGKNVVSRIAENEMTGLLCESKKEDDKIIYDTDYIKKIKVMDKKI